MYRDTDVQRNSCIEKLRYKKSKPPYCVHKFYWMKKINNFTEININNHESGIDRLNNKTLRRVNYIRSNISYCPNQT